MKRTLILLPLILSLSTLIVGGCRPAPDPAQVVPAFERSGLEPRVATKIRHAEAKLAEDSRSAPGWGRLGMIFHAHALYPQAVACYQQAAQLDNAAYRWPYLAALVLAGSDSAAALEQFERAVALLPQNEAVYISAGDALSEAGMPDRAIETYRLAFAVAPDSALANLGIGRLALASGELERAEVHLLQAVAKEPRVGEAHRLLAIVLRRQDEDARAAEHELMAQAFSTPLAPSDPAVEAMRAEAVNSRSYTDRGRKLAAEGRLAEAEEQFREVLLIRDANVRDLTNLGGALAAQGKTDEAISFYQRALQIDPGDAVAHNNFGMALMSQGQVRLAERELRTALELDSGYAEAHHNLGLLLARSNRASEAIEWLERAVAIDVSLTAAHNDLAVTLASLGRTAEAIDAWSSALRFGTADPSLRYNLSLALIQQGEHAKAIEHLRQGLSMAPNSSRFASLLAWELATAPVSDLRNGKEATTLARRVHDAYPEDPSATDVLAAALAESRDFTSAVTVAERSLQLARRAQNDQLASEITKRLKLYRQGLPFHQPPAR